MPFLVVTRTVGPARVPYCGGVVVGQNLEFLNVVDGGKGADTAGGEFIVVDAIEEPIGAVGAGTADGQGEGAAGGDLAGGGVGIEETTGTSLGGGAGGQGGELYEIAAIEGELRDFLGGDDLAESRTGGFDGDGRGVDLDGGALGGGR